MPRSSSSLDGEEKDKEFLNRCPSSSFLTPEANKPVPIRPFKRVRTDGEPEEEEERSPSPRRDELSPRRLDMDQPVALALDAAQDEEEEDRPDATQVVPEESSAEEGEILPSPLVRCMTTAA